MKTYEGYFENDRFYFTEQVIRIPERKRTIITVLDEPARTSLNDKKDARRKRRELWGEITALCGKVRPDIDEEAELAEAREEKYGRAD